MNIIAALILAVAILFIGRWEVASVDTHLVLMNKWTGTIYYCEKISRGLVNKGERALYYFDCRL